MAKLEEIQPPTQIKGILPDESVTVVNVQWFGSDSLELTFKNNAGRVSNELLYRHDEQRLEIIEVGRPWSFDGDGAQFRLVSEAHRIRLAHLFDPVLAVHTSLVDPLPHQITAVYESMLPRQPLRFLLADDPGAGKTIMAGLLIKELVARDDLQRCMVVCPGSLAEQWQDELWKRFQLPFEILTKDKLESTRTGNWFLENNLIIVRLDKLARDEDLHEKLQVENCLWDLIICDEAHKMSATFFGGEVKYTKRYRLGQMLSSLTRHFLLMTATPHNGKEEDFQLFMALLDGDRFEGKFRDGTHTSDVSDMMRRMVKENLYKFDGTPLFPERRAYTVPYRLSGPEARLYKAVTEYVRNEFNRVEALENDRRAGTVGFALTVLQRRLASSPEAIYQSLRRRKVRLENRLSELELIKRGVQVEVEIKRDRILTEEDFEDLEEAPEDEVESLEEEILDQATAARSISEFKIEIEILKGLESLALKVRRSGEDKKWTELANLLAEIFTPGAVAHSVGENGNDELREVPPSVNASPTQKLVIFTEHKDTLYYLQKRIEILIGKPEAVVVIHGGVARGERLKVQEAFRNDPEVNVLLATDAAGEGINLQRAHLMVNYDLPWNPNRLEQRFGRIHRIGQKEVCHLWNLLAEETREGDVYRRLLEKLEEARNALGGQVFDVLGKVQFEGKPLRELLIEAIRYGDRPEVRARLERVVADAFNPTQIQDLVDEEILVHDVMDTTRISSIREDMERADARRLQPHYIESFFIEAFKSLGGQLRQREPKRFQINRVPAPIRNRDRQLGVGVPVQERYERIVFDKALIGETGDVPAQFISPGHPLLDATLDLIHERNRDLLRRGTVLVDERDQGTEPRVLFYLEHSIQDAGTLASGDRRTISKRMLYVEMDEAGNINHLQYAPYLDYRPLDTEEPAIESILDNDKFNWITSETENLAKKHAIESVVPEHLDEVKLGRLERIEKTRAAVKARLTKEIAHWDYRAQQLQDQEQADKPNAKVNSQEARRRADDLQMRLKNRLQQLDLEAKISPMPPVVVAGIIVLPAGLMASMKPEQSKPRASQTKDTQAAAAKAREVIMATERELGFEPTDREFEKLGYDIESRDPATGKLRFIEVKGRITGAATVTVTRNEILYGLNKPDDFILAIVEFMENNSEKVHYLRRPFEDTGITADFNETSVNFTFSRLIERAGAPT